MVTAGEPRSLVRHVFLAIALLLFAGILVVQAGGGGIAGDWEFGLYGGRAKPDSYGGVDPEGSDFTGIRGGYFFTEKWSVEGSYQELSTEGDVSSGPNPNVDMKALRVNGLFNFRPQKKFRWFLTAGIGRERVEASDIDVDQHDFGYNVGGGGRWFFGKKRHFGLRADARWVYVSAGNDIDEKQTNYEGSGGIVWAFGGGPPPDSDSDGVKDSLDECSGTPKGAKIDSKGCPVDTDGDRVADGLDKCDNTPKGWKVDSTGCPADGDGDGVADEMDACLNTPKSLKVDDRGCPIDDADGDSIYDGADRCPNTPKGTKVDPVGCPIDADHDGVSDDLDKCPGTPPGTKVDEVGCPIS